MANLIRLQEPKFRKRIFNLREEQNYAINHTSLIRKWTVKTPDLKLKLRINGALVDLDFLDGVTFDIERIRNALRDIIPTSSDENELCRAEATMFGSQLVCTEHYRYFPVSFLFNMVFTGTLYISFDIPEGIDRLKSIKMEEEYAMAEIQVKEYLEDGGKLEEIENVESNEGTMVSLPISNSN